MRASRLFLIGSAVLGIVFYFAYTYWSLQGSIPSVKIESVNPMALAAEDTSLPVFELMSPLPNIGANADDFWLLPKLEFTKGPPERFLEKIQIIVAPSKPGPKERIIYFGRRTTDSGLIYSLSESLNQDVANLYKQAFLYSIQKSETFLQGLNWFQRLRASYAFLNESAHTLKDVDKIIIMDQASVPAFYFHLKQEEGSPERARIWFFRRNSLFAIELRADKKFEKINPEEFFRKSFLSQNRTDALSYVTSNLSAVSFERGQIEKLNPRSLSRPMSLLLAHMSLDPTSVDSFFHFAGLSTLLFKSPSIDSADIEVQDLLRNNVLAAEQYAKDIAPDSAKTAELSQLTRNLIRASQR